MTGQMCHALEKLARLADWQRGACGPCCRRCIMTWVSQWSCSVCTACARFHAWARCRAPSGPGDCRSMAECADAPHPQQFLYSNLVAAGAAAWEYWWPLPCQACQRAEAAAAWAGVLAPQNVRAAGLHAAGAHGRAAHRWVHLPGRQVRLSFPCSNSLDGEHAGLPAC